MDTPCRRVDRYRLRALCWCLHGILLFDPAHAAESGLEQLQTDELRLLYVDPLQTYLVSHVGRSFHNSLEFQKRIFQWQPYDAKATVLLKDFSDYGNAAATAVPGNLLMLDIAPPTHTFETLPGSERIYSAMNHELVHVAQGDVWNAVDARWRRLFLGKVAPVTEHPESIVYHYLTAPRAVAPRWLGEGTAVFLETWMSGGIGRAQGAYDEMVFRAMVRDGAHFYSNLGLVSEGTRIDFQVGANAYLYGTRFINYLALHYSPQHVIDWLRRGPDSERYYAKQFRRVFGITLEQAWDEWIAFEHEFQNANLERVRRYPLTTSRHLTQRTLGSISRAFVDGPSDSLVGGFRYPGAVAHVGALSLADGSLRRYDEIKGPMLYQVTAAAFDPRSRTFFYTSDNNAWRDLMALDLASGKARMLIRDGRIGDLAFNRADRSLWGLRHLNGYVTLVRIEPPYRKWIQVHTWPYGEVPFELDISPDGTLISMSMERLDGNQQLQVYRLEDMADEAPQVLTSFDFGTAIPEGFVFSPDGRYLFGSSYYTGISNIFRYEIASGELEAMSNAETGFFRPMPQPDGSLLAFEYTGTGFVPTRLDARPLEDLSDILFLGSEVVRRHPELDGWAVGSPARVDLESKIEQQGAYRPQRELEFLSGYPIVEGYKDGLATGWHAVLQDPVLFNTLQFSVSQSLGGDAQGSERTHADVEYRMLDWSVRYWHNDADFYDLFGPVERSRKGDALILGFDRALIYDEPRRLDLDASIASYTGLDTLPGNQNVASGFDRQLSARVLLDFSNTRKSLGAVDQEKGYRWQIGALLDRAGGNTVPKLHAGLDIGMALPMRNSSVWLYNSAGIAGGNRDNPLASWYLGAFGNNYVDDGEIKRYREFGSFPGFEIDELAGRRFLKTTLEWNITPLYFEAAGTPAFYLSWLRPAIFLGRLRTEDGPLNGTQDYSNVGAQIDLEFTFVHRLPLTLSFGYARGFTGEHKAGDEWMLSLKIM